MGFYAKSKKGTKELIYYGFASLGNKVMCREGYKSALGFQAHVMEVKDDLEAIIKQVGRDRVKIICCGPAGELEKIKPHMDGRLPIKYADLDAGSLLINPFPRSGPDTHVTILPEFTVPAGRMADFQAGFEKFYTATKAGAGASGCLYYGFAISGDSVYCREGYKNAEAAMLHGADIKEIAAEPMKIIGEAGVKKLRSMLWVLQLSWRSSNQDLRQEEPYSGNLTLRPSGCENVFSIFNKLLFY